MKFYCSHIALLWLAICTSLFSQAQNAGLQLGKNSISQVVKAMTLEEKVKLVVGKGFSIPGASAQDTLPEKNAAVSGHTVRLIRFGIPSLDFADGPSGIQPACHVKKRLGE